jgi:WD40 repeat protein
MRWHTRFIPFLTLFGAGCGITKPIRQFDADSASAVAASFSPDGKLLAAACQDGIVRVWEVSSGREMARTPQPMPLPPRGYTLGGLVFSKTGDAVAFAGAGGAVYIWNWTQPQPPKRMLVLNSPVQQLAFSSDKSRLIAAAGGVETTATTRPTAPPPMFPLHVKSIDLQDGRIITDLQDEKHVPISVALSPDGSLLAVTCLVADGSPVPKMPMPHHATGRLILRDTSTGRNRFVIENAGHVLLLFSPGGESLLAGEELWDTTTGRRVRTIPIGGVAFIDGGRQILRLEQGFGVWWELMASTPWIRPVRVNGKSGLVQRGRLMVIGDYRQRPHLPVRPAFSPDGRFMVDYDLNLWRLAL